MAFDSFSHRGEIKRFLKTQDNPEAVRKELEEFYNSVTPFHGIRIGSKYVIIENKLTFAILNTSDIVWVYHINTKTKLYGVLTTGSFHAIALRTQDGGDYRAVVMTAKDSEELLTYLFPRLPGAYFGYPSKIMEIWNGGINDKHASMRLLGLMQHQQQSQD